MNVLMLVGSTRVMGLASQSAGDAAALCLFLSGLISLAIAGFLLYRAPRFNPSRLRR